MISKKHIFIVISILLLWSKIFSQEEKVHDSIKYYKEEKAYLKAINFAKKEAETLLNEQRIKEYLELAVVKSQIYTTLKDPEKAIEIMFEAIKIAEKNDLANKNATIYVTQGNNYTVIQDNEKSKKYFHKALKIAKKIKDTTSIKNSHQNLFRLHFYTDRDSALYYMNTKMIVDRAQKSMESLAISYNNQFSYHAYNENFEQAKIYLDSSYHLAINTKNLRAIITSLTNYGYYYYVAKKDFKTGLDYFLKIINEHEDEIDFNTRLNVYQNLVYGYENLNEFQMANYYLVLVDEIKDQNYNERISDAVREVETLYQIEKVEAAYLSKENELRKKQIRNRKITFILIGTLVFILILFYFFYQNLRLKQRNKMKELDFEIQQNMINASIDGQEKERKRLADILHDNISALLSSASLHISAFLANNEIDSEDILKSRKLLKEAHDKVRDLSHELVPPLVSKFGLELAITDLCEKNSNSKVQLHCKTNLSKHKRYPEDFEIKIYYILSELCNNILKHAQATEAFISIEEVNQMTLKINISDNGIGFDSTKHKNIDGYGLTQIKARVKNMKGQMEIKSKINQGTHIKITVKIPLK